MASTVFPAAGSGVNYYVQTFTSTGTFTTPSNCNAVELFLVGGGGGGGGGKTAANTSRGVAGSGGGGGGVRKVKLTVTPLTSYTVTIGAGGSAGTSAAAGAVGGDTSFGTLAYAYGGGGGNSADLNTGTFYQATVRATGSGAIGTYDPSSFYNSSSGGGAGGSATFYTPAITSAFNARYQASYAPNSVTYAPITLGLGGGGGFGTDAPTNSVQVGGPGIDGYGAGGPGASAILTADATGMGYAIQSQAGIVPVFARTAGISTNGASPSVNTGHGGGGGGAVTSTTASVTANGGAGGSGIAIVSYFG